MYGTLPRDFPLDDLRFEHRPANNNTCMVMLIGAVVVFLLMSNRRMHTPLHAPVAGTASMLGNIVRTVSARLATEGDDDGEDEEPSPEAKPLKGVPNVKSFDTERWKDLSPGDKKAMAKRIASYFKRTPKSAVMVFAPWCPHCSEMMPRVAKVAAANTSAKVAVINAETVEPAELAGAIGKIEFFPCFFLFADGAFTPEDTIESAVEHASKAPSEAVSAGVATVDAFAGLF